jgi:hypothetical protein
MIKYFAGDIELTSVRYDGAQAWGVNPANPPTFDRAAAKWVGYVRAERKVEIKRNPSRHACDDRCVNATGRVMRCECACNGRNHGRGAIKCES